MEGGALSRFLGLQYKQDPLHSTADYAISSEVWFVLHLSCIKTDLTSTFVSSVVGRHSHSKMSSRYHQYRILYHKGPTPN